MYKQNEQKYIALVNEAVTHGYSSESRAGDTYSLPNRQLVLDLRYGFPLFTTRKIFTKGVWGELAAFVRGAEMLSTFEYYGCNYWRENAANWAPNKGKPETEWRVGKSYGSLWRNFEGVDQLTTVIENIKTDPYSRRHVITAWHPAAEACLPSCHIMFQFYVRMGYLHCHVYMRSVDLCVGLPSDVLLYATLMHLIAKDTNLKPATLAFSFGDAHVYCEHVEDWGKQQAREIFDAPSLVLKPGASTLEFVPDDAIIFDYRHHPAIKYKFMV